MANTVHDDAGDDLAVARLDWEFKVERALAMARGAAEYGAVETVDVVLFGGAADEKEVRLIARRVSSARPWLDALFVHTTMHDEEAALLRPTARMIRADMVPRPAASILVRVAARPKPAPASPAAKEDLAQTILDRARVAVEAAEPSVLAALEAARQLYQQLTVDYDRTVSSLQTKTEESASHYEALEKSRQAISTVNVILGRGRDETHVEAAQRVASELARANATLRKRDDLIIAMSKRIADLTKQASGSRVWSEGEELVTPLRACLEMESGETRWEYVSVGGAERVGVSFHVPAEGVVRAATLYDATNTILDLLPLAAIAPSGTCTIEGAAWIDAIDEVRAWPPSPGCARSE